MTTAADTEVKELKDFISKQFEQVNSRIDKQSEDLSNKIDKVSEDLNNKIDRLSEEITKLRVEIGTVKGEMTGINKRLDSLDFTNRTIFVAIVGALFAGLVKLFFSGFPGKP